MLTPRLPLISFSATLTIDVSTNSITAATIVVITMIALANPVGYTIGGCAKVVAMFLIDNSIIDNLLIDNY